MWVTVAAGCDPPRARAERNLGRPQGRARSAHKPLSTYSFKVRGPVCTRKTADAVHLKRHCGVGVGSSESRVRIPGNTRAGTDQRQYSTCCPRRIWQDNRQPGTLRQPRSRTLEHFAPFPAPRREHRFAEPARGRLHGLESLLLGRPAPLRTRRAAGTKRGPA